MKTKKSLYTKVASLLVAGTLSTATFAQATKLLPIDEANSNLDQVVSTYGNHAPRSFPNLDIKQLSEQGKIKSSQLIVKFKEANSQTFSNVLNKFSVTNIANFYNPTKFISASNELFSKMKLVSFSSGTDLTQAFTNLIQDPAVEYVAPNYVFTLHATTPNDLDANLWGLHNTGQTRTFTDDYENEYEETGTPDADIDAPEAWDIRHDASNTIVAVIDTGIDYNHSELASNMWTNPGEIAGNGIDDDGNGYIDDVHGYDFADKDSDPMDVNGHGTHCSGTIAAQGNNGNNITGVAWNTQLMALKVFADDSNGAYTSDIVNAILYAADNGAKVSNNSYGSIFSNSVAAEIIEKPMYDAISAANDAGMLFVAASGNDSTDLDGRYMSTPSDLELPNIISVAASNQFDEPAAWFTNYGKNSVDIAAPGEFIYSTLPGNAYATWNGTSMATPHVTGAAALLSEHAPDLTPAEIKAVLMNTVDKKDALADTSASGGRLNLHSALSALEGGGFSGECQSFSDTNDNHVAANRAYKETSGQTCWGTFCYGGTTTYYAVGSDESIGAYGFTTTTLYENQIGIFSKTEDCDTGGAIDAPPVLTLNAPREKYILIGTDYTLPQNPVSAMDREDGDITASVVATGEIDVTKAGRYSVTYNVTDSAGNAAAPVAIYINVTETDDVPQVMLQGPFCNMMWCSALFMEKDTPYEEPGYVAFDLIDGDLTDQVFIIDDPMAETSTVGIRFLNYDVIDSAGNHAPQHTNRLVAVLDAEMPHIWVRPPSGNFFSYANEYYTWKRPDGNESWYYSPSYAVFDLKTDFYSEEVVWEEHVTVTGEDAVDYTKAGDYTVTFTATDLDGNTTVETQVIHVQVDTTAPVVTLWGDSEITVEIGDMYNEPGGILKDDLDYYPRAYMKFYDAEGTEIDNPFRSYLTEETTYTIEYLGEDGAGNHAVPQYRTINVVRSHWNHAPVMPEGAYDNFDNARVYGTALDVDGDLNRVEIEFNEDGNWILIEDKTGTPEEWEYIPDWYGQRDFRIRLVDDNNNMYVSPVNSLLSSAPILITHSVQINGNTVVVSGTATDDENDIEKIIVRIDDGEWLKCEGTTNWSCTFEGVEYGHHTYQIRSKDQWTFYYYNDNRHGFTVNPAIPQIDSYSYEFEDNKLVVTGTASDTDGDLTEVHLLIGIGGIKCTGSSSFTCEMPDLVDGTTYDVALQARDAYGNQSTPLEFSFTYEAPIISQCITDTNYNHVAAGRAYQGGLSNLYAYAVGSDDDLGLYGSVYYSTTTSLEETSPGVWTKVTSCN
ncbi:MAG: DUF5011 domain-containing protein [Gammaproteobacteria bacterium]|nr:MAG: DUF5011 domain-containing protein [Gammaproteobacteria bacterium]